jgi:SAM-dependent methyltransferase
MRIDIRADAAKFYDLQPSPFGGLDVPFHINLIPAPDAEVLELGCGTGRVLIPMVPHCSYIYGVDISESMIALCRDHLAREHITAERAEVQVGDITRLELGRCFNLITAPYRVFQNLESDEEVDNLFRVIHRHLAPGGSCVLNVFRPFANRPELFKIWAKSSHYTKRWEGPVEDGILIYDDRVTRFMENPLICYATLRYRYYKGDRLVQEAATEVTMRCYYPDEFESLIVRHGFKVVKKWGGYKGEVYGEGPELIIQFTRQ